MIQWQPIETAPKDGTDILCYERGHPKIPEDNGFMAVAHWSNGTWSEDVSGWVEPTHWMPLPEPPTGEEG